MDNFRLFGLPDVVLQSLDFMSFHKPTPIQAQTIPSALEGSDILGSAQTGTGKTGAYGIPLVTYLLKNSDELALVLTPTRELALQVFETLKQLLGRKSSIEAALLIGGDVMYKQLKQLKSRPRLIVGTPGRVYDHLQRESLSLDKCHFLVLDETDRMLDMGFSIQLQKILEYFPEKRQTLMFSATMSPHIVRMAESYLQKPVRISVGSTSSPVEKIQQEIIKTTETDKYTELLAQLQLHSGSCIIFVKTKIGTEKLAKRLRVDGHTADAIHGDLRQNKRLQIIKSFRNSKSRLLVATDVAARGLDIPHIECVVNYDLPQCPEDYIHRIGRTGRAGATGKAVSLITQQDNGKWRAIRNLIEDKEYPAEGQQRPQENRRPRSHSREREKSYSPRRRDSSRSFSGSNPHDKDADFRSKDKEFPRKNRSFDNEARPSLEKRPYKKQSDDSYQTNEETKKSSEFKRHKEPMRPRYESGNNHREHRDQRPDYRKNSSFNSFKSDRQENQWDKEERWSPSDRAKSDRPFKKEFSPGHRDNARPNENRSFRKPYGEKLAEDRPFRKPFNDSSKQDSFKQSGSFDREKSYKNRSSFDKKTKEKTVHDRISTVGSWSKDF